MEDKIRPIPQPSKRTFNYGCVHESERESFGPFKHREYECLLKLREPLFYGGYRPIDIGR